MDGTFNFEETAYYIDFLVRYGFDKVSCLWTKLDYIGLGCKLAFRNSPELISAYPEDILVDGDRLDKETDLFLYFSLGYRNLQKKVDYILIPVNINIGVFLTPGFSSIADSSWRGFFLEATVGFGFGIL